MTEVEFTISFTRENHYCLICSAFVLHCGAIFAYKLVLTYMGKHVCVGEFRCAISQSEVSLVSVCVNFA